jgi:hypothetical protein
MQVGKLEINSEFKFSYQLFLAGQHISMLSEFSTLRFPFRPGRKKGERKAGKYSEGDR